MADDPTAMAARWICSVMILPLAGILKAVGPNASIVFAALIFMTFLQQRYDSAIDRYREDAPSDLTEIIGALIELRTPQQHQDLR